MVYPDLLVDPEPSNLSAEIMEEWRLMSVHYQRSEKQ